MLLSPRFSRVVRPNDALTRRYMATQYFVDTLADDDIDVGSNPLVVHFRMSSVVISLLRRVSHCVEPCALFVHAITMVNRYDATQ